MANMMNITTLIKIMNHNKLLIIIIGSISA